MQLLLYRVKTCEDNDIDVIVQIQFVVSTNNKAAEIPKQPQDLLKIQRISTRKCNEQWNLNSKR